MTVCEGRIQSTQFYLNYQIVGLLTSVQLNSTGGAHPQQRAQCVGAPPTTGILYIRRGARILSTRPVRRPCPALLALRGHTGKLCTGHHVDKALVGQVPAPEAVLTCWKASSRNMNDANCWVRGFR